MTGFDSRFGAPHSSLLRSHSRRLRALCISIKSEVAGKWARLADGDLSVVLVRVRMRRSSVPQGRNEGPCARAMSLTIYILPSEPCNLPVQDQSQ